MVINSLGRAARRRGCIAALLCTLCISSCTQPTPGKPVITPALEPWTGPLEHVSVVWSAEPNIDLLAVPAVIVRAYLESYLLARGMGTVDVTYPGFTHAVTNSSPGSDPLSNPWPETTSKTPHPVVGTEKFHLLKLDGDGGHVDAVVCSYGRYTTAYDLGGGFGYEPVGLDDGVIAHLISMKTPDVPQPPLPPQRGPARAPSTDVFGNWKITGMRWSDLQPDSNWPTMFADVHRCRDLAPDPVQRRKFLRNGKHPRSDYPTLPPYPGWPEAGPS